MSNNFLPQPGNDEYDPNLEAQDEEVVSGGNNRLLYGLVGLMVALVVGYVALPKGQGSPLAAATPSFMLDDAAVTATRPTAADSLAAGLKTAPAVAVVAAAPAVVVKPAPPSRSIRAAQLQPAEAPAPVASAGAIPAATPAPAAPAPAPAPAASATATQTVSGKIDDENGRPLVGATVLLKGSSKGTSTDANGSYTLEMPSGSDNTLIYGYGGYNDEEMRVRTTQKLNVTLTPRAREDRRRR